MPRNKWGTYLLTAIAIACGVSPAVAATPFFEVTRGGAYLTRGKQLYYARVASQMIEGDKIETGRLIFCFLIDYKAGTICADPFTQLSLERIRRDASGCIDERVWFDGELDIAIAPFTCPTSSLLFVAPNRSTFLLTGTKIELSSEDEDSKVLVFTGEVTAVQQKARLKVPHGYGAIVRGQNAPKLFKIDYDKALLYKVRHGQLSGEVSPLATVEVNGELIVVDDGKFTINLNDEKLLVITVIGVSGDRRTYQLVPL